MKVNMKKNDIENVNWKSLSMRNRKKKKEVDKNNMTLNRPKYMHIFIMPYEKGINIRGCNYGVVSHGKMNIEIAQAIIGYVDRKIENYNGLLVSWYGDEPLLSLEIIKYLSESLISICELHSKQYFADITTNGYLLTLDIIRELYLYKVYSYRIIVDSEDTIYERLRNIVNGGEPFDVVLQNLFEIKKYFRKDNLSIVIRLNIKGDKEDTTLVKYVHLFKLLFSKDKIFDLTALVSWKSEQGDDKSIILENNGLCAEDKAKFLKNSSAKSYDKLFDSCTNEKWRSKQLGNCLVIGHDGKLYKYMSLYDEEKSPIGYISNDGTFNLNKYDRSKKD